MQMFFFRDKLHFSFQWCIVGHLTASVFEMNETSEPEIFLHQSLWLIDHWLWNRARFEIPCRSRRSGVAKNIGAPIMPGPFQLFRCPFRFEMSTCGFGEVRQTIRKYFKIPPLTIKCRSSVKSWDLWDPGVMSVDIDSLLLFRRQTAKTIDQLWEDYWDFVAAFAWGWMISNIDEKANGPFIGTPPTIPDNWEEIAAVMNAHL